MADAAPDGLMSAPPGVDHDAGSANTIAATIDQAREIGLAHVLEISQDTLAAGDSVGDLLPLPGQSPDHDTSILGGQPPGAPGPQGSGIGDNG